MQRAVDDESYRDVIDMVVNEAIRSLHSYVMMHTDRYIHVDVYMVASDHISDVQMHECVSFTVHQCDIDDASSITSDRVCTHTPIIVTHSTLTE